MERTTEHQIAVLLRTGADIDIIGDVSVTVHNPSDLIAWANVLTRPTIVAWRASSAGCRYLHVTARHTVLPVHGIITAVLLADHHRGFWDLLFPDDLPPGVERTLAYADLITAWTSEPLDPT